MSSVSLVLGGHLIHDAMQIIIPSNTDLEEADRFPGTGYRPPLIAYADTLHSQADFGTVVQQNYRGPDFHIGRSFTLIERRVELSVKFDQPTLMLSYLLDGEISYLDKGFSGGGSVIGGRYHLSYENTAIYPISLGKGYLEYLHIGLSERYFRDMDIAKAQIGDLLEAARQKSESPLHSPFYKITARIRKVVGEIIAYRGEHVNLYIQSRINELLLQFLLSTSMRDFSDLLFTSDQQKLKSITDYIEVNLDKHLTVDGLAKKYGYAGVSLHKKFKWYFGTTLYQYILEQRMLKARKMLTGNVYYPVATIAYLCGYRDSSNFLAAFKKRFGHSTSYYRMIGRELQL